MPEYKFEERPGGIWAPKSVDIQLGEQSGGVEQPVRLPKVVVGVAYHDGHQLNWWTENSIRKLLLDDGKLFESYRMDAIGYITDDARNDIARVAMEKDYDFVFYADSDMTFPEHTIARMIAKCADVPDDETPVIAGLYNSRKDYRIHAYKWTPEKKQFRSIHGKYDEDFKLNNGLYPVDAAGTGCMLLDCAVFNRLEWPWFYYKYEYNTDIGKRQRWSEDIVFCHRLMEAGIKVYLDTDIVAGHIQPFVVKQVDENNYNIEELS
ncbi:MAG: hypothetical protein KKD77_24195 [Gammaproteobacteria bacterium]|nr:hypothetical protein [Gammaproteobacteria bacterium]